MNRKYAAAIRFGIRLAQAGVTPYRAHKLIRACVTYPRLTGRAYDRTQTHLPVGALR